MYELNKCECGAKPRVYRSYGWWHIECPACHNTTHESMGCTDVWGYNTRKEATDAWNRLPHIPATVKLREDDLYSRQRRRKLE